MALWRGLTHWLLRTLLVLLSGFPLIRYGYASYWLALCLASFSFDWIVYEFKKRSVAHIPGVHQFIPPFSLLMRIIPLNYFCPYGPGVTAKMGELFDEYDTELLWYGEWLVIASSLGMS